MNAVTVFLNSFFEAERRVVEGYLQPDLDAYNLAVDRLGAFVDPSLKSAFGAKLSRLMGESFYERMKKHPPVELRYLYRLDSYQTADDISLHLAFVSNKNPKGWKAYHECLLVSDASKIVARFIFTDCGAGTKAWYFGGGQVAFTQPVDGVRLLNPEALGEQMSIERLMAPDADTNSLAAFEGG